MVVEPRKVEPGFTRRWSGQALELVTRSFHIWFGVCVVFCAICTFLNEIEPEPLLFLPLGLFIYFTSVEFAAASDERVIQITDVPGLLKLAAKGTFQDL